MATNRTVGTARRRAIRNRYWADIRPWTGENEKGWFRAPRTLPLLLALLSSKSVSGNTDPTRVYLELLARHIDGGVVQMTTDEEHAYGSGYEGARGVRSWRERMRILEAAGAIHVQTIGAKRFGYALLVHPADFVARLREQGKVSPEWWEAYRHRQTETGELSIDELEGNAFPNLSQMPSEDPSGVGQADTAVQKKGPTRRAIALRS